MSSTRKKVIVRKLDRDTAAGYVGSQYIADGTEVGPIVVGGLRAPMGDAFMLGGEVRWQKAEADLSSDFLFNKLDLGGFTYQATFTVRF